MDFHSMNRKDLQALCKKHKIPANGANAAMAEALTLLLLKEAKNPTKGSTHDENQVAGRNRGEIVVDQAKKVTSYHQHEDVEIVDVQKYPDFYSLKRKDLQALCKKNNLPAKGTNVVMAEALTSLLKAKQNPIEVSADEETGPVSGNEGMIANKQAKKVTFCFGNEDAEIVDTEKCSDLNASLKKEKALHRKSILKPSPPQVISQEVREVPGRRAMRSRGGETMAREEPIVLLSSADEKKTTKRGVKVRTEEDANVTVEISVVNMKRKDISPRKTRNRNVEEPKNVDDIAIKRKHISPRKTRKAVVEEPTNVDEVGDVAPSKKNSRSKRPGKIVNEQGGEIGVALDEDSNENSNVNEDNRDVLNAVKVPRRSKRIVSVSEEVEGKSVTLVEKQANKPETMRRKSKRNAVRSNACDPLTESKREIVTDPQEECESVVVHEEPQQLRSRRSMVFKGENFAELEEPRRLRSRKSMVMKGDSAEGGKVSKPGDDLKQSGRRASKRKSIAPTEQKMEIDHIVGRNKRRKQLATNDKVGPSNVETNNEANGKGTKTEKRLRKSILHNEVSPPKIDSRLELDEYPRRSTRASSRRESIVVNVHSVQEPLKTIAMEENVVGRKNGKRNRNKEFDTNESAGEFKPSDKKCSYRKKRTVRKKAVQNSASPNDAKTLSCIREVSEGEGEDVSDMEDGSQSDEPKVTNSDRLVKTDLQKNGVTERENCQVEDENQTLLNEVGQFDSSIELKNIEDSEDVVSMDAEEKSSVFSVSKGNDFNISIENTRSREFQAEIIEYVGADSTQVSGMERETDYIVIQCEKEDDRTLSSCELPSVSVHVPACNGGEVPVEPLVEVIELQNDRLSPISPLNHTGEKLQNGENSDSRGRLVADEEAEDQKFSDGKGSLDEFYEGDGSAKAFCKLKEEVTVCIERTSLEEETEEVEDHGIRIEGVDQSKIDQLVEVVAKDESQEDFIEEVSDLRTDEIGQDDESLNIGHVSASELSHGFTQRDVNIESVREASSPKVTIRPIHQIDEISDVRKMVTLSSQQCLDLDSKGINEGSEVKQEENTEQEIVQATEENREVELDPNVPVEVEENKLKLDASVENFGEECSGEACSVILQMSNEDGSSVQGNVCDYGTALKRAFKTPPSLKHEPSKLSYQKNEAYLVAVENQNLSGQLSVELIDQSKVGVSEMHGNVDEISGERNFKVDEHIEKAVFDAVGARNIVQNEGNVEKSDPLESHNTSSIEGKENVATVEEGFIEIDSDCVDEVYADCIGLEHVEAETIRNSVDVDNEQPFKSDLGIEDVETISAYKDSQTSSKDEESTKTLCPSECLSSRDVKDESVREASNANGIIQTNYQGDRSEHLKETLPKLPARYEFDFKDFSQASEIKSQKDDAEEVVQVQEDLCQRKWMEELDVKDPVEVEDKSKADALVPQSSPATKIPAIEDESDFGTTFRRAFQTPTPLSDFPCVVADKGNAGTAEEERFLESNGDFVHVELMESLKQVPEKFVVLKDVGISEVDSQHNDTSHKHILNADEINAVLQATSCYNDGKGEVEDDKNAEASHSVSSYETHNESHKKIEDFDFDSCLQEINYDDEDSINETLVGVEVVYLEDIEEALAEMESMVEDDSEFQKSVQEITISKSVQKINQEIHGPVGERKVNAVNHEVKFSAPDELGSGVLVASGDLTMFSEKSQQVCAGVDELICGEVPEENASKEENLEHQNLKDVSNPEENVLPSAQVQIEEHVDEDNCQGMVARENIMDSNSVKFVSKSHRHSEYFVIAKEKGKLDDDGHEKNVFTEKNGSSIFSYGIGDKKEDFIKIEENVCTSTQIPSLEVVEHNVEEKVANVNCCDGAVSDKYHLYDSKAAAQENEAGISEIDYQLDNTSQKPITKVGELLVVDAVLEATSCSKGSRNSAEDETHIQTSHCIEFKRQFSQGLPSSMNGDEDSAQNSLVSKCAVYTAGNVEEKSFSEENADFDSESLVRAPIQPDDQKVGPSEMQTLLNAVSDLGSCEDDKLSEQNAFTKSISDRNVFDSEESAGAASPSNYSVGGEDVEFSQQVPDESKHSGIEAVSCAEISKAGEPLTDNVNVESVFDFNDAGNVDEVETSVALPPNISTNPGYHQEDNSNKDMLTCSVQVQPAEFVGEGGEVVCEKVMFHGVLSTQLSNDMGNEIREEITSGNLPQNVSTNKEENEEVEECNIPVNNSGDEHCVKDEREGDTRSQLLMDLKDPAMITEEGCPVDADLCDNTCKELPDDNQYFNGEINGENMQSSSQIPFVELVDKKYHNGIVAKESLVVSNLSFSGSSHLHAKDVAIEEGSRFLLLEARENLDQEIDTEVITGINGSSIFGDDILDQKEGIINVEEEFQELVDDNVAYEMSEWVMNLFSAVDAGHSDASDQTKNGEIVERTETFQILSEDKNTNEKTELSLSYVHPAEDAGSNLTNKDPIWRASMSPMPIVDPAKEDGDQGDGNEFAITEAEVHGAIAQTTMMHVEEAMDENAYLLTKLHISTPLQNGAHASIARSTPKRLVECEMKENIPNTKIVHSATPFPFGQSLKKRRPLGDLQFSTKREKRFQELNH